MDVAFAHLYYYIIDGAMQEYLLMTYDIYT